MDLSQSTASAFRTPRPLRRSALRIAVVRQNAGTVCFRYHLLHSGNDLRIPTKPPGYTERYPRTVPI
jgi:hypothetical protein